MRYFWLAVVLAVSLWAGVDAMAEESSSAFFVDLSKVANRDLEDDAIADNGKGGWTDEGVNDFFVFPKLAFGQSSWRGTPFNLIDPAKNNGRAVVMLKGAVRCKDLASIVTAPTPSVKGKYVYFMHTACGRPTVLPGNLVATYRLTYDDHSTAEMPIHQGTEIQQWYVGQWWDNHEALRYPVYMGRNAYSGKWNQWVGIWATQWANPHPEKPIVSVTFESAVADVPVIFAVTIADTDFAALRDTKENKIVRPEDVPEGFFDAKLETEHKQIFDWMLQDHQMRGVRSIDLIRPDLVAVTVDSALGNIGSEQGEKIAAAHQIPGDFTLQSKDDSAYSTGLHPASVTRQTKRVDTLESGPFAGAPIFWHTYYLHLSSALKSGSTYKLTVAGIETPFVAEGELRFDPQTTATPSIKVNQVGYFAGAKQRYAYLGWWDPEIGAVDFSGFKKFDVIDESNGKSVLTGDITLRDAVDKLSGEQVSQMDLSALGVGKYHIVIPGLGRSFGFYVGGAGATDLYFNTMRAFMHQRCGCELTSAVTDWPRAACHVEVYENKHLVENHPAHRDDEPIKKFYGGYHDAGDFDTFASHLPATSQAMTAYELYPKAFGDHDLKLPESGGGIPDILSEAAWALKFDADTQQPDGGILFGRANDCDSLRQVPLKNQLPFGLFTANNVSSNNFAAVATQYSRLLRPFDKAKADMMLEKAEQAYAWAKAHQPKPGTKDDQERYWQLTWGWAAAELFNTTGKPEYNEDYKTLYNAKQLKGDWQLGTRGNLYDWPYMISTRKDADPAIQAALRKEFLVSADWVVKTTQEPAYRMGRGKGGGGWGNLIGGGFYGDTEIRAYWLTGDQKYLDAASLNADFQLGANPLSTCFITGMGTRFPQNPELNPALKSGLGKTVKGISIYGPGGDHISGFPKTIPIWRCYEDNATSAPNSEFTITETIGPASVLYASLWAIDKTHGSPK